MRIFMRFPGGLEKAFTMSYDDGVSQDERFLTIADPNGIRATFNLNTAVLGRRTSDIQRIFSADEARAVYHDGHEVAMHGHTHAFFELMSDENLLYEILENRRELEAIFRRPVRGLALPWGSYSQNVLKVMREAGVAYSRTVNSSYSFDVPDDFLEWHPTCHHGDARLNELADRFLNTKPSDEYYRRTPYLFYVWGHTYEFDRDPAYWENIEHFCDKMGHHDDVWYATNGQIYDYCTAFRRLEFSLDGSSVYNPSCHDIFFEYVDHEDFQNHRVCIPAGKTDELRNIRL